MRFRLLETRGIPAGNASGNFSPPALLAHSEERGPWVGGGWSAPAWSRWGAGSVPASVEHLAAPRPFPSSTLAGIFRGAEGKVPNSERVWFQFPGNPSRGGFSLLPSLSAVMIFARCLAAAFFPCSATLLGFPRQEFSQEIPLSSPRLLPLQGSKKLTLEIRSQFKFRCLHYLEFGFINYLHLVHIKKLSNADVLISEWAWRRDTKLACVSIVSLNNGPSERARNCSPLPGAWHELSGRPSCVISSPRVTAAHLPAVEISLISRANLGKASSRN